MPLQDINAGIIYTNTNCIGCNKCISGCIAVGANVVVKDENSGQYVVRVDPEKCILCGACIDMCVHHARTYIDDTEEFFSALKRGEEVSILVSSTLLTDYEKQYKNILGYLKHLGVKHIYNTGFGGDIMVWAYMNFIRDYGLSGSISQFCPVISNYIEKYRPELIEFLMPVQSPLMCTAIYVADYLKNTDKLAYISPCIASKYEISDVNTYNKVAYNVTFERLMEKFEGIDISAYEAVDEADYGLGALIPMSGGLSDNIERYIGFNEVLIQTAGPEHIFPYFDHYYKQVQEGGKLPFLADALSCANGCNFGTGCRFGVELRNEMTFSAHNVKEHAYGSGMESRASGPEERFEILNRKFAEYELSSFVRQFGKTRRVKTEELCEQDYEKIFNSMYKDDASERRTDCGACGYKTCRDMAYAIGVNINHKENCINYSKKSVYLETQKTKMLVEEISKMNEELIKSTQLKSNFLANMSHEIRTPMNAIIGMAEMALRSDLGEEERGYLNQIKASSRSLLAIINDILDFSKIESGKMELNEIEYEVMSIINDTVNIVMTRIDEKNIELVVDADPNIPYILYGDDIRIKQILVNLANNAVKFTKSGCVEISLQHEKEEGVVYLTVAVRDTGIGIRSEDLEKLFTSFQQVDSKRNRNEEGTGLGLAISREFVKLMNGTIHVSSEYGKGSVFSFRIPQKVVDPQPSVTVKQEQPVKTAALIGGEYLLESFLKAVRALNVSNTCCKDITELEEAVEKGVKSVFVEFSKWNSDVEEFAKKHSKEVSVAVVLDPRKNVVVSPYVKKLHIPVYSLNVASIINNEPIRHVEASMDNERMRFEAPGANILIVDDNTINLTVAKGLLSPLRMNIHTATGAVEALELLGINAYDIVFMDHMMPDIDGIEATHMIREMGGEFKSLPIIALTANAINDAKEMFIREGMNDFVAKPIDVIDITAKLRKWLPQDKIKQLAGENIPEVINEPEIEIEGLDTAAALKMSGTKELYLAVLADYFKVIEKKASLIELYEREEELGSYTIEVHALKSASKLIGATKLSEMAAALEKCGHEGSLDIIHRDTAELLTVYRGLIPILAPFGKTEAHEETESFTADEIKEKLEAMVDALDNFDCDKAMEVMDELMSTVLSQEEKALREELNEAVESMEYDDGVEIATRWLQRVAG